MQPIATQRQTFVDTTPEALYTTPPGDTTKVRASLRTSSMRPTTVPTNFQSSSSSSRRMGTTARNLNNESVVSDVSFV